MARTPGYLSLLSSLSNKAILDRLTKAFADVRTCMDRPSFFGAEYQRNSADLTERLRQSRFAMKAASEKMEAKRGVIDALHAWKPDGGTGSVASQLLKISDEASDTWNRDTWEQWVRSLLERRSFHDPADWQDVRNHVADFVDEVLARLSPAPYSDPDNLERNRWLYEMRVKGKSIPTIMKALDEKKSWDPLGSENAIRSAIKSYATFSGKPVPKGTPGRPARRRQTPQ